MSPRASDDNPLRRRLAALLMVLACAAPALAQSTTATIVGTISDAGGVLELVRDGETGLVAKPEPEALGRALSALMADAAQAAEMGAAGRQVLQDRALTWPRTVERLLA